MTRMFIVLSLLYFLSTTFVKSQTSHCVNNKSKRPHIITILADDLGWNDVGFHGSNQIPTPNIDALAYNGIILNSHYTFPLCTPSRAALMTGKYPTSMGMQHFVILEPEPRGLPLEETLLPEYLRNSGYTTHAIGKWHLGYYTKEYTPTYRGFDSFFGYWNGVKDYYSHVVQATLEGWRGLDIRRNTSIAWDAIGKYSTDLFTEEAVKLIEEHDESKPMFMYLSHLAVHSGNQDNPFQAPDEAVAKFTHINDPERRTYAAMVSKLDDSVGKVIKALRKKCMLRNSIVLFMSDNGAKTIGIHENRGSNYPLRGLKGGPFEGAIRGVAALWSPLIKNRKRVSHQLMSIVDWLPTLYSAAGLNPADLKNLDGKDMWSALINNEESPRDEILINIDDYESIRKNDFKYVKGANSIDFNWYGEHGRNNGNPKYDPDEVLLSDAGKTFTALSTEQHLAEIYENKVSLFPANQTSWEALTPSMIMMLRRKAELKCSVPANNIVYCNPFQKVCLYNIKNDPCEMVDLSSKEPKMVKYLEKLISEYRKTLVSPNNKFNDPKANPIYWNNTWVSWASENL